MEEISYLSETIRTVLRDSARATTLHKGHCKVTQGCSCKNLFNSCAPLDWCHLAIELNNLDFFLILVAEDYYKLFYVILLILLKNKKWQSLSCIKLTEHAHCSGFSQRNASSPLRNYLSLV